MFQTYTTSLPIDRAILVATSTAAAFSSVTSTSAFGSNSSRSFLSLGLLLSHLVYPTTSAPYFSSIYGIIAFSKASSGATEAYTIFLPLISPRGFGRRTTSEIIASGLSSLISPLSLSTLSLLYSSAMVMTTSSEIFTRYGPKKLLTCSGGVNALTTSSVASVYTAGTVVPLPSTMMKSTGSVLAYLTASTSVE